MFFRRKSKHIHLVKIYVDDIIFRSTDESLCKDLASLIHDEFEMSLMEELTYFLGFQIKKAKYGTFLRQIKYCLELKNKFDM